jgi:hypothetical protein
MQEAYRSLLIVTCSVIRAQCCKSDDVCALQCNHSAIVSMARLLALRTMLQNVGYAVVTIMLMSALSSITNDKLMRTTAQVLWQC